MAPELPGGVRRPERRAPRRPRARRASADRSLQDHRSPPSRDRQVGRLRDVRDVGPPAEAAAGAPGADGRSPRSSARPPGSRTRRARRARRGPAARPGSRRPGPATSRLRRAARAPSPPPPAGGRQPRPAGPGGRRWPSSPTRFPLPITAIVAVGSGAPVTGGSRRKSGPRYGSPRASVTAASSMRSSSPITGSSDRSSTASGRTSSSAAPSATVRSPPDADQGDPAQVEVAGRVRASRRRRRAAPRPRVSPLRPAASIAQRVTGGWCSPSTSARTFTWTPPRPIGSVAALRLLRRLGQRRLPVRLLHQRLDGALVLLAAPAWRTARARSVRRTGTSAGCAPRPPRPRRCCSRGACSPRSRSDEAVPAFAT